MHRHFPIWAFATSCLVGPSALAAGFDPVLGVVDTSDAAFSLSFEDVGSLQSAGVQGYTISGNDFAPVSEGDLASGLRDDAIEGAGSIALGGVVLYTTIDLSGAASIAGQRAELVFWQKPNGTRVSASLAWYGSLLTEEEAIQLGSVQLLPTGNVSSDGWEEWSTGPVDWAWAGAYAPIQLTLVDDQLYAAYGGGSFDFLANTLVDGLHVKSLGAATVGPSACTLLDEASTCGAAGVCHLGRCVDAALRMGAGALSSAAWRADYIDRRVFEMDAFEGGRHPQSKVPAARAVLDAVKGETNARAFWSAFSEAYALLEDGHASPPMLNYPAYANAGVCLHEGEADLIDGAPITPLVFSSSGDNAVSAQLQVGDALIAIDGAPVNTWVNAAGRLIAHHGDLDAKSVVQAPSILGAALETGAVLTFSRCAGPTACAAGTETTFDIDLSTIGDDVLAGSPVSFFYQSATCDYRFLRPVPGDVDDVADYDFAGFDDADGIRSLLINGVPSYYGRGGQQWFEVVEDALLDAPPLLLLDERTGGGGGVDAVDWIAGFLVEEGVFFGMDFMPHYEDGDDQATRDAFIDCATGGLNQSDCGNAFRWVLGEVAAPTRGTAADSKLAVLTALDVSGNDYLTRLLRQREASETRVFGPSDTLGAYGVIWSMPNHLGELSGGSLQTQDTLFLDTANDPNMDWATSAGEPPDQVVRQKQSDALLGVDTTIEAARAWLETP